MKSIYSLFALILGMIFASTLTFAQEATEVPSGDNTGEVKVKLENMEESVSALVSDVTGLKKLKVTGYLQVQYENSQSSKGFAMNPYDSSDYAQSRLRVRRSRLKFAYDAGMAKFVLQGDFSNEKFELKDAYMTIEDPWTKNFALTTGVFNRPNYEVEYSSSARESMERSSVIRALYPGERDLGLMITAAPNDLFKLQLAAFNNTYQGTYKQFMPTFNDAPFYYMARITKELLYQDIGLAVDFGAHARFGDVVANTNKIIESGNNSSVVDSNTVIKGDKLGRNWFGVEAQVYYDFLGGMKLLGEYIAGADVNELTPANRAPSPIRKRNFSGYYAMLVKNITDDWQIAIKYDSYDPNTKIENLKIIDAKDLAVSTLGFGIHNYSINNIRISLWYDMIRTETQSTIMKEDPKDDLLTLRFQFKF